MCLIVLSILYFAHEKLLSKKANEKDYIMNEDDNRGFNPKSEEKLIYIQNMV